MCRGKEDNRKESEKGTIKLELKQQKAISSFPFPHKPLSLSFPPYETQWHYPKNKANWPNIFQQRDNTKSHEYE